MKKLDLLLKALVAMTFFVPLLFFDAISTGFVFPFIVPKILAFRTLALLMLLVYIILLFSNSSRYKVRKNPLTIAVLVFFTSFTLSTFLGVDPYKSFWDSHERMLGLFTLLHFAVYFVIVGHAIRGWDEWKWILRIFLFAGAIEMFLGLLQKGNPDLFFNQGSSRIDGTLGNPIYFGGYAMFVFFLGTFLAMKEKVKVYRVMGIIGALLGFVGIWLSGTRGTQLALIASVGFAMLMYLFVLKEHKKVKVALAGVLVLGIMFFIGLFAFKDAPIVQDISFLRRLSNISLTEGTGRTRLMAWGIGIQAWQDKPLFGWGPNGFLFAFNKYYKAEFLEHGWGETWFDNAHNVLVNTLTTQGIVGLLAYLSIYLAVARVLFVAVKEKKIDPHSATLLMTFFVAHLVHNFFVFENPTSYIYFFFALGFVVSISQFGFDYTRPDEDDVYKTPALPLIGIIAIVALTLIHSTNYQPMKANQALLGLIQSVNTGKGQLAAYEKVQQFKTPHIDDIRHDFARTVWKAHGTYVDKGRAEEIYELALIAERELQKNETLHPLDVRDRVLHKELLIAMYNLTSDKKYVHKSLELMEKALPLSPKRQQILYSLGQSYYLLGDYATAEEYLIRAKEDAPLISEAYFRLASIYKSTGQNDKILPIIEEFELVKDSFNKVESSTINFIKQDVAKIMASSTQETTTISN